MERIIAFESQYLINFRDFDFAAGGNHCYQWIDIKRFDLLDSDADDREVLAAVTAAIEFRDDYVGGGVNPDGDVHGPYWLDRVTVDTFDPASPPAMIDILERWVARCGALPDELRSTLQNRVTDEIKSATNGYLLEKLDRTAINDYADIHTEFHEFVLINRASRKILLMVASDD